MNKPLAVAATLSLAACAVPATDVAIPTMSMEQALRQAHADPGRELDRARVEPHLDAAGSAPLIPRPEVSPPDIRMAYLYEWVDAERNKHFGSWVAIPVSGFDWVGGDHARR